MITNENHQKDGRLKKFKKSNNSVIKLLDNSFKRSLELKNSGVQHFKLIINGQNDLTVSEHFKMKSLKKSSSTNCTRTILKSIKLFQFKPIFF